MVAIKFRSKNGNYVIHRGLLREDFAVNDGHHQAVRLAALKKGIQSGKATVFCVKCKPDWSFNADIAITKHSLRIGCTRFTGSSMKLILDAI